MLRHFRITEDPSSGSFVQCLAKIIKMAIFIILAKHCTKLTDDGSSVIRNMSEHFQNIFIILIVSTNYKLVNSWIIKCLNVTDAWCKHEDREYKFIIQEHIILAIFTQPPPLR